MIYFLYVSLYILFLRNVYCECKGKTYGDIGFVPAVSGCLSIKFGKCAEPEDVETKFLFYRNDNPEISCVTNHRNLSQCNHFYKQGVYTVLMINGFKGRVLEKKDPYLETAKNLYLKKLGENVNLILVDWSNGSSPVAKNYQQAVANSKVVGRRIGLMVLHFKSKLNLDLNNVLLRGFSLGAQIMGEAARFITNKTGEKVGELGVEDPASPCFDGYGGASEHYLTFNDAHLVKAHHTDAGHKGMSKPLGHYDFYPDGGSKMPNCGGYCIRYISDIFVKTDCNHRRSTHLTVIDYQNFGECQPVSYNCDNYDNFLSGKCANCDNDNCHLLGYGVQVSNEGNKVSPTATATTTGRKFYIKTSADEPYCEYHFQIIAKSNQILTCDKLYIELPASNPQHSAYLESDGNQSMTALITIPSKLTDIKNFAPFRSAKLTKSSIWRTDCSGQIESITINYMSNIDQSVRELYSSKLVKDPNNPHTYNIKD